MAYLEEMLMRQAMAAQERQAAQALLRRLQQMDLTAAARKTAEMPMEETVLPEAADSAEEAHSVSEREAAALSELLRGREAALLAAPVREEEIRHSNAPVQRLLRQLAVLAGDSAAYPAAGTMASENAESEQVNWMRMAQRVERAVRPVQSVGAQRGERLASEGPRSMEAYGLADAAALSRLYERDARRYDSRFELPL